MKVKNPGQRKCHEYTSALKPPPKRYDLSLVKTTPMVPSFNKIVSFTLLIMILLSSFLFVSVVSSQHSRGIDLDATYGDGVVELDANIGSSEWSDSEEKVLQVDGKSWTFSYKHDSSYLYIMSNYAFEHFFEVCFDVDNDGGNAPQDDDVKIHMSFTPSEKVGNGSYWEPSSISGWTSTSSFQYTHEIRVEFNKLGITSGTPKTFGFAIFIMFQEGSQRASYPEDAFYDEPDSWAQMGSSDNWAEPVSEPPELDLASVTPEKGITTDDFEFSVTYSDPDGDAPTRTDIFIDGTRYNMIKEGSDFLNGAGYTYTADLPWGDHEYHFVFSDGETEVRYPFTGEIPGPRVYLPNSPPVLDMNIPSDIISIPEDGGIFENLLDLEEYFSDDRDDGELQFQIEYQQNSSLVHAYLNGSFLCLEQIQQNWFGSLELRVEAFDNGIEELPGGDHESSAVSNTFAFKVEPRNDPVTIRKVQGIDTTSIDSVTLKGNKGAVEDEAFSFQVRALDIDLELDDDEKLTFQVDDKRFSIVSIDEATAEISFTPENKDVGEVTINISVHDEYGSSDVIKVTIEVQNTNDIPYIDHVLVDGMKEYPVDGLIEFTGMDSYYEDEWFNATIVAIDDDLLVDPAEGYNFQVIENIDGLFIDSNTGEIGLQLTQNMVGVITFNVTLKDREGWDADDSIMFRIEVKNVNDPPYNSLIVPEKQELEFENGTFVNLTALVDDIDLLFDPDEELFYEWISDRDGMIGSGPLLSTDKLTVGIHNITVLITDRSGESTSNTIQIEVKQKDKDYTVGDEDEGVRESLYLGYIILILIIFFLTVMSGGVFVYGRIKRKQLLDNIRRKKIFELVNERPGVYFMDVSKELGLSQGVLSHHLNMLEKFEFVRSMQDGKYRRFYPYDHKVEFNLNLTNIQQMILYIVKEDPGISQTKISKSVGKNKVVVNYHVKILRDIGFLDIERDGRLTHCFITGAASDFINE